MTSKLLLLAPLLCAATFAGPAYGQASTLNRAVRTAENLEHAFMKVHTDNYAHPDYKGMSASKYPYKDAVWEVDMEIGMVVKALAEADVLENTLIFVTSDNGSQMDGWPDAGYTPFRGGKGTTWEGGVRVPGIAYWKGMIKPGRVSDACST